MMLIWWNSRKS